MAYIDCHGTKVELNYLNSYNEIFTKVKESYCSLSYTEFYDETVDAVHETTFNITCGSPRSIIDACNITGTWQEYDADINIACSFNTERNTYTHRNIFCKLCNPPAKTIVDNELIDGRALNAILEGDPISDACLQYEETPLLHPYKNIFCFFLSMRNENREPNFFDINEKVTIINSAIHYSLNFKTGDISPLLMSDPNFDMRNSVSNFRDVSMNNFTNEQKFLFPRVASLSKKIDIEKLLHLHFLHYGLQERCNMKINISEADDAFVQKCGCGFDCIYTQTCCADFALSKPISLISVFGKSRYLIDRCYGNSYGNISRLCEDDGNENNVLSLIPITISNNHFKNVYCLACNNITFTDNETLQLMSNIGSDSYTILCDFFPNINPFFASLDSLMDSFIQMNSSDIDGKNCSINSTLSGFEFNDLPPVLFESCNITGKWQNYDADIEWACQNYLQVITPFPLPTGRTSVPLTSNNTFGFLFSNVQPTQKQFNNIFCQICNMDERLIHSENRTTEDIACQISSVLETLNPLMETLCYNESSIITRFPLKNEFCRRCVTKPLHEQDSEMDFYNRQMMAMYYLYNTFMGTGFSDINSYIGRFGWLGVDLEAYTINVYRTLFSVTSHINIIPNNLHHNCKSSEVFDQHTVCILFIFTFANSGESCVISRFCMSFLFVSLFPKKSKSRQWIITKLLENVNYTM